MRYSLQQYGKALLELVEESPKHNHREVMRKFFNTLSAHGALPMLQDIVRDVSARIDAGKNMKRISVRMMEKKSEESVHKKLHFRADVSVIKDARIIGGTIVEMDGVRVDNSIAMRMKRLRGVLVG